jgi:hypothetical protein
MTTPEPRPAAHDTILPGELSQAVPVGEETLRYADAHHLLPGELSQAESVVGEATVTGPRDEPPAAPKKAAPQHQTLLPGELSEAASLFDGPEPEE